LVCLVVLVTMSTQQASAFAALQDLASASANGPVQTSGSAAGHSHRVGASATELERAGAGDGHRLGRGELAAQAVIQKLGRDRKSGVSVTSATGAKVTPPASLRQQMTAAGLRGTGAQSKVTGQGVTAGMSGATPVGRELVADRTATTSVFQNADGTRTMRVYSNPVHFKEPNGTWGDIDTSLVKLNAAGRWTETANSGGVSFATMANDPALVSWSLDAQHSVSYGLQGAAPVSASVDGSSVTYADAGPSTDVIYNAEAGGIKETLLLRSSAAPTTWTFPLRMTGLTARLGVSGDVEFIDSSGKVELTIPHGYMEDASVSPGTGEGAMSTDVTYALVTVDGAPALRMTLNAEWLHASGRVFPVRVDPASTMPSVDSTVTTYVDSSSPGNYSDAPYLYVGTFRGATAPGGPANAYLDFPAIGSSVLQNDYIEGVTLNLAESYAADCSNSHEVDVNRIDDPWNVATVASYPGVTVDNAILGSAKFTAGSNCTPTAAGSYWETIPVGTSPQTAGSQLVESWAHGSANYGLAVTAPTSDDLSWPR
jgi:hypothetical protein